MSHFVRLSAGAQRNVLERVIERCSAQRASATGAPPVIVFDLDGTLYDNRPRTLRIVRELAHHWRETAPDAAKQLETASLANIDYLLTDTLTQLGVKKTELVAQAEIFWRERFFVDGYLEHDEPLAGAVTFARACYDAGAILIYFTGRDLPLMGTGTFASLRDRGFPIGVIGTELVLKPDASMPDEAFKRLVGPELSRVGRVLGVFDNEPANCNILLDHFPDADVCLVDTQHLPGAPDVSPNVHILADFAR